MKNLAIFLIKPDAMALGLDSEIIQRITECNLTIINSRLVQLDEMKLRILQPVLNMPSDHGEEWKYEIIKFMTSRPVYAILAQGNDALIISNVIKKDLREKYISESDPALTKIIYNLLHTASSEDDLRLGLTVLLPEFLKE